LECGAIFGGKSQLCDRSPFSLPSSPRRRIASARHPEESRSRNYVIRDDEGSAFPLLPVSRKGTTCRALCPQPARKGIASCMPRLSPSHVYPTLSQHPIRMRTVCVPTPSGLILSEPAPTGESKGHGFTNHQSLVTSHRPVLASAISPQAVVPTVRYRVNQTTREGRRVRLFFLFGKKFPGDPNEILRRRSYP